MFGKFSKIALAGLILAIAPVSASYAKNDKTYAVLHPSEPAITAGMGRIYFYRESGFGGALVQPSIKLNGEVVGDSSPGDYFYVDRLPGDYEVVTTTEKKEVATLTLQAGQTVFVKTRVSMGLFVGHVLPSVVDATVAEGEIKDCDYDPSPVILSAVAAPAPAAPAAPAATTDATTAPAPATPPAPTATPSSTDPATPAKPPGSK